MYITSNTEALKVIQQLREDLKKHYQNHKTKRDEYLLSKANLESDAGNEEKTNKRYQKGGTTESMVQKLQVPPGDRDISPRNQSNINTQVMEDNGRVQGR